MNYPDKIAAAKHLYRRCHHAAPSGEEALLRVVEDAMMAGMERSSMTYQTAVNDYLARVARHNYTTNKERQERRMNKDIKEREGFIQNKEEK